MHLTISCIKSFNYLHWHFHSSLAFVVAPDGLNLCTFEYIVYLHITPTNRVSLHISVWVVFFLCVCVCDTVSYVCIIGSKIFTFQCAHVFSAHQVSQSVIHPIRPQSLS